MCWVLFRSSLIYTVETFELVENRLYAYANGFKLLIIIVRKPADRPAVAASLNRDLDGI